MRYNQGCASRGCGLITTVMLLLVGAGIVWWIVTTQETSLDTLLHSTQNLVTLGARQVNGPVMTLTRGGDGQAADLFIENWELDPLVPDTNIDDGGTIPIFWSVTQAENNRRTIRWEMEVGTDESQPEVNLTFDETTIYLSVDDRLQALRQADGKLLWEAVLSDLVKSRCRHCIQLVNGRLVVLSVDQVLQALDATTGETIWQVRLNDDSAPSSRFGFVGFAVVGQQILVIDGSADAGHAKELRFYNVIDGSVIRQLSPTCSAPDSNLLDKELNWQSPVLVDERNHKIYFIIVGLGFSPCVQSWDISSGEPVWQVQLLEDTKLAQDIQGGLYLNPSGPFLVLGQESLYVPVATAVSDSAIVRLDLNSGRSHLLLAVEDFALTPLEEQGNVLIVRAKRARGSERTELWGLDRNSGERFWRHELQANVLLNVDSGVGQKWAYHFTSRGLAVIQLIPDPDRLLVQMIDPATGRVGYETSSRLDNDFWTGVTWTNNTAYLTIRNLYAVDLATGKATLEWP